uniref:Uncharacterized protein n=1 Tax=Arundo donax TaxID=35708 RepID=A0A0A9DEI0_ARUDO
MAYCFLMLLYHKNNYGVFVHLLTICNNLKAPWRELVVSNFFHQFIQCNRCFKTRSMIYVAKISPPFPRKLAVALCSSF